MALPRPSTRAVRDVLLIALPAMLDVVLMALATWTVAFVLLARVPGSPEALAQTISSGARHLDASATRAWVGGFDARSGAFDRWWHFVSGMVRGDFGWSWSQQRPVFDVIADALPYTLALTAPALLLAMIASAWLGTRGALDGDSTAPSRIPAAMRLLGAIPPAWLALFMALVFAGSLGALPLQGACDPRECTPVSLLTPETLLARVPYAVLPVATLSLVLLPAFTRLQWQTTRVARTLPHVQAAVSRGLTPTILRRRHVWRMTGSPMASVLSLTLPSLLGGAVFVERVFAWPGMGSVLLQAVNLRDYGLVAAMSGCIAVAGVAATRALEMLMPIIDPRRPNDR